MEDNVQANQEVLKENILAQLSLYKELLHTVERQNQLIINEDIDGALNLVETREMIFNKLQKLVSLKNEYNSYNSDNTTLLKEIDRIIHKILDSDRENEVLFRSHMQSLSQKITAIATGKKLANTYSQVIRNLDAAFFDKKK